MTLSDLRDYFKSDFPWKESISVGKIDKNKERAVCFYHSKVSRPKINTIGGKANRSYTVLPISILLRFGKNYEAAAEKAKEIYDFFDEKTFDLNNERVFVISPYNEPIDLGTDDQGVYENSLEFDLYITKKGD
jgi:hypothetical protein